MNVPFNMGREGADMIFRPGNRLKHMANMVMQPIEGFNPLGGAGNFIQTILPAIADPIVGLLQNRDAFNRPIAKEDIDKSKPTPGWTRAKEGATGLSKKLAYGINFLSGGGEFGIGALSPTPDQVDYTLGQITGGLGREVSKGAQSVGTAINAVTGTPQEETPWYRVPVVGRLYGNVNEPGNVKAQIYADKESINALDYEHKQMLKAGERERAAELLAEHPEIRLKSRIDTLLREEAELRKQRVKLRANSDVEAVNATNAKIDEKLIRLRDEIRRVKG
jgi:Large polyvalent protein associated domain 38